MNQFFSITNSAGLFWQCGEGFVSRDPEHATKYDSESEANKVALLNERIPASFQVVPNLTQWRKKLPPPRVPAQRRHPQPSAN